MSTAERMARAMVELTVDLDTFTEALERFGAAATGRQEAMARRHRVRRAGLEARYYVRGGLDPAYASPAARDAYALRLIRRGQRHLALAFMQGWAVHRNGTTETGRWVGSWMGHARSFVTPESRSTA